MENKQEALRVLAELQSSLTVSEWHCRGVGGSAGGKGTGKVSKSSRADGAARAVPSGE